jgi:hypothetical protein
MRRTALAVFLLSGYLIVSTAFAQSGAPANLVSGPIYAIVPGPRKSTVVEFRSLSPVLVELSGTWLLPKAHGEAEASLEPDGLQIKVRVKGLRPASDLGPAFLTYVLWAVSPGGNFKNLGELVVSVSTGELSTTTNLDGFALVVTAEPYFAVSEPSEAVVLKNAVPLGNLRYSLAPGLLPLLRDSQTPLDLVQARNAVRIARRSGAEQSAPGELQKAVQLLSEAERDYHRDDRVQTILKAREATQAAENARRTAAAEVF